MNVRTTLTRVSSTLLLLAIAALVVFAIGSLTGAYRTISILSGSMDPTLSTGDAIISTPVPVSKLRSGDVITFRAPIEGRPLVTHRIVDVQREAGRPVLTTRGDANDAVDPWPVRLDDDIAWRQAAVIPGAGTVLTGLRGDDARVVLRYGVPSLLVMLLLVAIWAPSRRRAPHEQPERIDLNAILDTVQAHLVPGGDATCPQCESTVSAHAACPFCDAVPGGDRVLAAA